ncbi:LacI family DNA-binding transcriptional regulator [Streptomyces lutosisoli]
MGHHLGRRIGIVDVAAAAGVSVTTVSHILNEVEGKRVNTETRQRVPETARQLGYAPNGLARGLRLMRSSTIGCRRVPGAAHAAPGGGTTHRVVLLRRPDGEGRLPCRRRTGAADPCRPVGHRVRQPGTDVRRHVPRADRRRPAARSCARSRRGQGCPSCGTPWCPGR